MAKPSRIEFLSLYRGLLKQANLFDNYNFKNHAVRRIKYEFKSNVTLSDNQLKEKFDFGKTELESLKRQTVISLLYPEEKSVMQNPDLKRNGR